MRFDLLDEYSTLVPFGLGISQNRRSLHAAAGEEIRNDPGATTGSRMEVLHKFIGLIRQTLPSRYRNVAEKHS